MREIYKSKFMIGFIVLMAMFTLVNSSHVSRMNKNINKNEVIINK